MTNRLALVLGASKGIGRDTFAALRRRGVHAIGVARTEEKLESLVEAYGGEKVAGNVRDADSIRSFVDYTREALKRRGAQKLHVLYAPGMHEPSTIEVDGKKEYTKPEHFVDDDPKSPFWKGVPQFFYEVNVKGMQDVYESLHVAAQEDGFALDFVFISSQAAKNHEDWMLKGNPFYAAHKHEGEVFLYNMRNAHRRDLRALQFGLAGKTMAKKLIDELTGKESWMHVDNDSSKPLRPLEELALPLEVLADDIAGYMLREGSDRWKPAYESSYGDFVHEYVLDSVDAWALLE